MKNDYILYGSIYVKCPEEENIYRQKVDQWLPGAGVQNGERDSEKGRSFFSRQWKCSKLDSGDSYTTL